MPPEPARRLVVDLDQAQPVRAEVGPMAWFVFEAMAARCEPGSPFAEVAINTRHLGDVSALSKDTVGRAIRILVARGLVTRIDRRDELSGRFAAAVYVVNLCTGGLELITTPARGELPAFRVSTIDPRASDEDRGWTQLSLPS